GDGRIVAGEGDGALEILDGGDVVAALVRDPAEAVEIEAVVGADRERAADERFRLVELDALFGVRVAEVVERRRVAGIELDGALHVLDALVALLGLVVERAEREVVAVVLRMARDQLL